MVLSNLSILISNLVFYDQLLIVTESKKMKNQRKAHSKKVSTGSKVNKAVIICLFSFFICRAFFAAPIYGQSDSSKTEESDQHEYPERRKSRETWEKIVSFPGTIVYFPFKMAFKAAEKGAAYVDESKLVVRIADKLTADDGLRGVRPYYSSRAGAGIKVFQKGLVTENSKLTFTAAAGLRERKRFELRLKRVQFPGPDFLSDYRIRYQFLSDESFFGIGKDAHESDRRNFAHEQLMVSASFKRDLNRTWSMNALPGFEHNEIGRGRNNNYPSITDLYSGEDLLGLDKKNQMAQFQLALQGDTRNHPAYPTSGSKILLASTIFQQINDDQFGFWKFIMDLSHHIHLFYNRTIVLRMAAEVTEPLSDRAVPFYHLSELGRHETIRGFKRGRFRDFDMILGSFEYRYPVWFHTDIALFVDAGQVSGDIFNETSIGDFRVGYGFGIRFRGVEDLISIVEISKSRQHVRFYFALNPGL